jgi:hypothetical protein
MLKTVIGPTAACVTALLVVMASGGAVVAGAEPTVRSVAAGDHAPAGREAAAGHRASDEAVRRPRRDSAASHRFQPARTPGPDTFSGGTGMIQQGVGTVTASLTVTIAGGRSTFVPGELIPLELVFRREGDFDYYISAEDRDWAGRLDIEQYVVTPSEGTDDPLAEYLEGVPGITGRFRDVSPRQGSPFTLNVHLNEWVRFTQPGSYELVVTSRRLRRHSGQPAPELRSEPVTLRIQSAPDGWYEKEFARAEAAITSGDPEQVQMGMTILRHLGTRDAALALVRHYSAAQSRFDLFAGLVSSPYRADIVEAMEARLDTGRTLPQDYTRELAILRTLQDHPPGTIDPPERAFRVADAETEYRRRWLDALMGRLLPPRLAN